MPLLEQKSSSLLSDFLSEPRLVIAIAERRKTDNKFHSNHDEMTLRLGEVEIQRKKDRQNSEKEKEELQGKFSNSAE